MSLKLDTACLDQTTITFLLTSMLQVGDGFLLDLVPLPVMRYHSWRNMFTIDEAKFLGVVHL